DLSVKSLRYLSSEQALADLAYFITKFKEEKNLTANKVIAFGCSYAGSLAVWFRLKYPHLVHEYLDVVTLSLARKGSDLCVQEIRKATKSINRLLKCRKGWRKIEHIFRLCSPLDGLNAKDVSSLFKGLSRHFKTGVQ
ncbi:Lysosomal Pro-X carboxypeptidase, partial [Armadillidium vulgare]